MKHIFFIATVLFLAGCGSNNNEKGLSAKKAELAKLKTQQADLSEKIKLLETEISKLDTAAATQTARLVYVATVEAQPFNHYIDLQSTVDADNISYVAPRGAPGQVKSIFVKKGDLVKAGQLLLKLDDVLIRQQILATQTQLNLAKDVYRRQKNLWDQSIGTELQLINAKNNVDQLENALKLQNEQLNTTNVYADVSGIVDQLNVRVGETFMGFVGNMPQVQIVNTSSLKVTTHIPENYLPRVNKGSKVLVMIPDLNNDSIQTTISLLSQSISPTFRGFVAEAKIPYNEKLKPNMVAIMKILDYSAAKAIVVPVNIIQSDERGKYIYVMEKNGDKSVSRKVNVVLGEAYGNDVEIKSGLSSGQQIITEGYQSLYDGQSVSVAITR